ncbi:MAG: putative carboxypeptidase [Bacteroidetes bacterium]|nr:putative carboxypeptidase [Bacteroidota bacterium]
MTIRSSFPALPAGLAACILTILVLSAPPAGADQRGRPPSPRDGDPCGLPDTTSAAYRAAALQNWGYGYDSLRADLTRWSSSPYVRIDSVGATVENRGLYMLTIQATGENAQPRKRIWIHARTHPGEVQGTWVTNQIITQLLGTSDIADKLRHTCVFNIMPMINPDGVELKYARQNAHGIDIESNWSAVPGEPEVQTLRRMFGTFMAEPNPILIALNMHSAYGEKRYFVYHAAAGTSPSYAAIEQRFINGVRGYFPGGIQPYDYFVSWTSAPSLVYPESWFWQNHRESVLAMTYEDMNSTAARAFDSTANAILRGIADELGVSGTTSVAADPGRPSTLRLEQNFPNPFNPSTTIRFDVPASGAENRTSGTQWVRLDVFDMLGREVATIVDEAKAPGTYDVRFDGSAHASGVYVCRLQVRQLDSSPGDGGMNGTACVLRSIRMVLTK